MRTLTYIENVNVANLNDHTNFAIDFHSNNVLLCESLTLARPIED